jgi:hypothetical protein
MIDNINNVPYSTNLGGRGKNLPYVQLCLLLNKERIRIGIGSIHTLDKR